MQVPRLVLPLPLVLSSVLAVLGLPAPVDPTPDIPVVRISLEAVRVDVVVTDGRGRQVTDLTRAEFEIREDSTKREITHFAYVRVGGSAVSPAALIEGRSAEDVPARPPERAGFTTAFVVDDLSLSFPSMVRVRNMLHRFVAEQMQPRDAVAIVRVGSGIGTLQQFTTDKRMLRAAIDGIRFNLARRPTRSFTAAEPRADVTSAGSSAAVAAQAAAAGRLSELDLKAERSRAVHSTSGSLGALHRVLQGMRGMAGRKAVILLSESLSLEDEDGNRSPWLTESLQRATDAANRSSVVVSAVDPTGLETGPLGVGMAGMLDRRRAGLTMLAHDTGGLLVADTNDLTGALARLVDDQKGYYLVGYVPDSSTFSGGSESRYHKIHVSVKRPGLRVRTRAGFYAVPDGPSSIAAPNPARNLVDALRSPFVSGELEVRLTALFAYERYAYVRSLLHVSARHLSFEEGSDGSHTAAVRLGAMVFDASGQVAGQAFRSGAVQIAPGGLAEALRDGVVDVFDVPALKPGAYQLRAGVQDVRSGRCGAASQFFEIPDVSKGRLAVSGIVLTAAETGLGAAQASPSQEGMRLRASPAVRRFHPGSRLAYSFFVYNLRIDSATGRAVAEVTASVLSEDRVVQQAQAQRLEATAAGSPPRVAAGGILTLGAVERPGTYTLQVTVTDAQRKKSQAEQWVDFEVAAPTAASMP
jgi:VWFA-related protein